MSIATDQNDRIVTIRLENPAKLNSITPEIKMEIRSALERYEDDDITAIVLESAGDRAFCSGADLDYVAELSSREFVEFQKDSREMFDMIDEHSAIVIAAVDGLAYGGGFEFALASDMIVADCDAMFAVPEVNIGLIPGGGGTQRLLRKIGSNKALEMVVTGDPIDAVEAQNLGLVNRLIEDGDVSTAAYDLAETVASKPPLAVEAAKQLITEGQDADLQSALSFEQEVSFTLYGTEDCAEGIQAFLEDRSPNRFKGR